MPTLSIAIPTYEMKGLGTGFLDFSFNKLSNQSFKDFEIVISDHSRTDDIKNLCENWSNQLNIKYIRNENKIGSSSANINNAIKNSSGDWIKILFQDDFLYDYDSLEKLVNVIKSNDNLNWIITACEHSNDGYSMYKPMFPHWNEDMYLGNNTFSSPSVMTIKNTSNKLFFNEDLIWLMDVEYYKRMYDIYGEPYYLPDISIVNRTWGNRLSDSISKEVKDREYRYMVDNYKGNEYGYNYAFQIFDNLVNLRFDQNILYGRGIVDINEHLNTIKKYVEMSDHVTEMGTRFAISTYSLLLGRPKKAISIDLNYHFYKPYENEINKIANMCGVDFNFVEADVLKIDIEKTDMLFIDTLHTYEQLSKELRKHESNVNKWIILHDTVTFGHTDEQYYQNGNVSENLERNSNKKGLYNALTDFLEENKNWRIKEHYTNNNGLTVIERI